MKIVIGWRRPEQEMMRSVVPAWFARTDVEKESGGGESIGPKARRHVCMKEQSTDTFIEVRRTRSTRPFCCDVYGQVKRKMVP